MSEDRRQWFAQNKHMMSEGMQQRFLTCLCEDETFTVQMRELDRPPPLTQEDEEMSAGHAPACGCWYCLQLAKRDAELDRLRAELEAAKRQSDHWKAELDSFIVLRAHAWSDLVDKKEAELDRLREENERLWELRDFVSASLEMIDNPLIVTHLRALLAARPLTGG